MSNHPSTTQRELSRDEQATLLHRIQIYAPDAPYALKNLNSNFRDLFKDKFSPEDVLQGASEAFRDCIITTEEREAYRQLFSGQ